MRERERSNEREMERKLKGKKERKIYDIQLNKEIMGEFFLKIRLKIINLEMKK